MKIEVQFHEYLGALESRMNEPLSLELALSPFGVGAPESRHSSTLLVGHLADYLAEQYTPETVLDFLDVAEAATELGLDGAEDFLALAPHSMFQILRSLI